MIFQRFASSRFRSFARARGGPCIGRRSLEVGRSARQVFFFCVHGEYYLVYALHGNSHFAWTGSGFGVLHFSGKIGEGRGGEGGRGEAGRGRWGKIIGDAKRMEILGAWGMGYRVL